MNGRPQGKGFFIWKILHCEGGDPQAIADMAYMAGFSHVLIKVANGPWRYNFDENDNDLCPAVVAALKAKGIEVWGWHYVFGDIPEAEAEVAMRRVEELGLDGYVIDAEAEYKRPGMANRAVIFMDRLNVHVPVALSSYRYPTVHPEFPWHVFLPQVDLAMPQVYWIHAHNPTDQLLRTLDEYADRAPNLPIIPTGAAFKEWGWIASPTEVNAFMATAEDAGLSGVNFWEWSNCRRYIPDAWQVIAEYEWEGCEPPPPPPPPVSEDGLCVQVLVDRLRIRREPRVASGNIVGTLPIGALFATDDLAGAEIWVKVPPKDGKPGGWSAMHYRGGEYIKVVG